MVTLKKDPTRKPTEWIKATEFVPVNRLLIVSFPDTWGTGSENESDREYILTILH